MDANITTLIAAFVLANIGSGPIKGFAITLALELCAQCLLQFLLQELFI